MLEDGQTPNGLREEEKEAARKLMELLEELADTIQPPLDPRVTGLLIIAADLLNQQIEMDITYNGDDHEHEDKNNLIPVAELTEEEAKAIVEELEKTKPSMDFSKIQQNLLFLVDEEPPSLPGKTLGDKMADDINKWFDELDANGGAF